MEGRPDLRVVWTDPSGLRAQATRAAASQEPRRPRTRLEALLSRLRARGARADEQLVELAWEAFAAGFTAREDEAPTPGPDPATRSSVAGAAASGGSAPAPTPDPAAAAPTPGDDALADLVAGLSPRRLEVLRLVARGLTNREIGEVLGISAYTVKAHVAGVLEALDLTNRTEAAVALREYEAHRGAD
jgi:DNA-binding CsgD family transcriptional regulator